jgi:tripartite-type tricarboxylate transporter receptor subunit TctC
MAYAKNNPKKVKIGHLGFGHPYHIMFFSLAKANNLDLIEIPFKGSGDLKTALLGGHVDIGVTSLSSVKPFVDSGKLFFLAVQNPKRMLEFPSVPTFEELGYKFSYYASYGLFVSKGTPGNIRIIIHDAVKKVIQNPALKKFAEENILDLYYGSAADLGNDVRKDIETIAPLVEELAKKYNL